MTNVVELLSALLEQVTPSKGQTPEQWSDLVSRIKSDLNSGRESISTSSDPLTHSFSTVLNALQTKKSASSDTSPFDRMDLDTSSVSPVSNPKSPSKERPKHGPEPSSGRGREKNSPRSPGTLAPRVIQAIADALKGFLNKEHVGTQVSNQTSGEKTPLRRSSRIKGASSQEQTPSRGSQKRPREAEAPQPEAQVYFREPYSFRSGSSKGGAVLTTPEVSQRERPKRSSTGSQSDTRAPTEEPSVYVPPLDLQGIVWPEVTDRETLASAAKDLNISVSQYEAIKEIMANLNTVKYSTSTRDKDRAAPETNRHKEQRAQNDNRNKEKTPDRSKNDSVGDKLNRVATVNEKETKGTSTLDDTALEESHQTASTTKEGTPQRLPAQSMSLKSTLSPSPQRPPRKNYNSDKEEVYFALKLLKGSTTKINLYLVATEMIRAKVRNTYFQRDVFNINAIDPSVYRDGEYTDNVEYSFQMVASNVSKQHHVNFGDVLRLKRVNADVVDRNGKRYVNIILSDKFNPTMRLWHADEFCRPSDPQTPGADGPQSLRLDFNKNTDSTRSPERAGSRRGAGSEASQSPFSCIDEDPDEEEFQVWRDDAITLMGSDNMSFTNQDYKILRCLKEFSRTLDPFKVFRRADKIRKLSEATVEPFDFVVEVLSVSRDNTFIVCDSSAKALVVNLDAMLVSNLFESVNPIKEGDWLKLRSFLKVPANTLTVSASSYSCITRLPRMSMTHPGDGAAKSTAKDKTATNGENVLTRKRTVNLDVWTRTSCLNNSFPKRFRRSPTFIQKLLSAQPAVTFQKASPQRVTVEKEEGEISQ